MTKQPPKKRPKKYKPKLALKKGVEWGDLINLSFQPDKHEAVKKIKKKGKSK
jgi:hypothetical protein